MEYDSRKLKIIDEDECECPFCGSLNVKRYIYGYPRGDYDRDKFLLGGCVIKPGKKQPKYKCSDCEKEIIVSPHLYVSEFGTDGQSEKIEIGYSNNKFTYHIILFKGAMLFWKEDYNGVYVINTDSTVAEEDYEKFYNELIQISSDWIKEFDNNELVSDDETLEWALMVDTHDNRFVFIENKVPSNMNEFKKVVEELEEYIIKNCKVLVRPNIFGGVEIL